MSCGLGLPALSPLAHPLAYNNFGLYGGYPYASSLGLSALAHPLAYNNFGLSSLAHPYTALATSPFAAAAPALF
ncbi:unnamed protein product [Brachionus calyciflorus]|uniref:Uncharacterized protein n=1 Tax=Brachionus calyciflorus TaxID=104777 RepID=A0A813ULX3_9BILA|nr:unnamed protein product [Brachionus calyciflorus]